MNDLEIARNTIRRLNRRCQMAESALAEKATTGISLGRSLANYTAQKAKDDNETIRREMLAIADEAQAEGLYGIAERIRKVYGIESCPRCGGIWKTCPCAKACPVCGGGPAQEKRCECRKKP